MNTPEMREIDVLVVGTGIAGCAAALAAARGGARVLLATKDWDIRKSSTALAQGGIIARGVGDTTELLVEDIVAAGDGLVKREAAELLAQWGPRLVESVLMDEAGVDFARNEGRLDYTREAAHSVNRILHVDDRTGEAIEDRLVATVRAQAGVELLAGHTLAELLAFPEHARDKRERYAERRCVGALLYDEDGGECLCVLAKKVVLATGGIGQVYLRTTNPDTCTGDGLAVAARAGAEIVNAEFVQFHPTALALEGCADFLISESVRGEGAQLVDENGVLFMDKIDPRGSLAPRDVVARAVWRTMRRSRSGRVYLDLKSYLGADFIRKRFPLIYATCRTAGVDITRELVPIAPIAHYFCGGIKVDGWGRTSLRDLYAAGEVSCTGLHGANRLASTSLLEGLVWGTRCGEDAARALDRAPLADAGELAVDRVAGQDAADANELQRDWTHIKHIMWNSVGIERNADGLDKAVHDLENLRGKMADRYAGKKPSRQLIELRNGVETALLIARAARDDKESRGCHTRTDG